MLAYVFWHRPRSGVGVDEYEERQREFHSSLDASSACFRIAELPFGDRDRAYEDWYLVDGWAALGELNESAVDSLRRNPHDRAATHAAAGWGSVYMLARGTEEIPDGVEWLEKPRGEPSDEFVASLPHGAIWRRQLVLGPAPEFCCSTANALSRTRL